MDGKICRVKRTNVPQLNITIQTLNIGNYFTSEVTSNVQLSLKGSQILWLWVLTQKFKNQNSSFVLEECLTLSMKNVSCNFMNVTM